MAREARKPPTTCSRYLRPHPSTCEGGAIKQYWKSHIIGIGLQLNMQFSGCNAIMMFTQKICAEAGMGDGSVATMFAMGLQVLVTAFACSIMDSLGLAGEVGAQTTSDDSYTREGRMGGWGCEEGIGGVEIWIELRV